ncbi:hypothetical protein OSB04_011426 [Centaurea solstitialis]|uniref:CCHC-type domain-containing protein n=1 Tax=Centaurea solstitialis TaxID=347529 RepID=A0AA38TSH4_9ASTR|nr:hypothetical protein OSB04_011426 [Centaurea solstitialis]
MVQTRNNPSGSEAEQVDQLAARITETLQEMLLGLFEQMRDELVQTLDQRIDAALTARSSGSGSTAQSQSRVVTFKDFMAWAFRTSGCPAGSKVLYAVNLLRNAGKDWWDLVLRRLTEAHITALTWEEFKVVFDEEFAPSIERERLASEFLNMTQTTESVNEITAKFLEKLLFVPGYANDKSLKMARYVGILKTDIKGAVSTKRCKTFNEMVETARAQELHLEESQRGKRKAEDQSVPAKKFKGAESDTRSGFSGCAKCGRNHKGECRAYELLCYKCGKPGHFSRDCKETTKTCFHYNQPGHIKPDCPQLNRAPMTAEEAQTAPDVTSGVSPCYVCRRSKWFRRGCAGYLVYAVADRFEEWKLSVTDMPVVVGEHQTNAGSCEVVACAIFEVDERLNYMVRPIVVLERKVRKLVIKEIVIMNVQGRYRKGSEWIWEPEAEMRERYLGLVSD